MTKSGFVAGTLVHTNKGLVPIEQLKVGDMVLSKHETGGISTEYRKIERITSKLDERILALIYVYDKSNNPNDIGELCIDILTGNHPVWVSKIHGYNDDNDSIFDGDIGWVAVSNIVPGSEFKFHDNSSGSVIHVHSLYQTPNEDIFYIDGYDGPEYLINLKNNKKKIYYIAHFFDGVIWRGDMASLGSDIEIGDISNPIIQEFYEFFVNRLDDFFATRQIYNFEIADFHTYFIGKAGILTQSSANIAP